MHTNARTIAEDVENVDFQVMDFQHLNFATSSFDLVNARFIQWFLNQQTRTIVNTGTRHFQ